MKSPVRTATLLSLLFLTPVVSTTVARAQSAPPVLARFQGGEIPPIAAVDRAGLADLRGRVVIVNLWATWCPACRMDYIQMTWLLLRFRMMKKAGRP